MTVEDFLRTEEGRDLFEWTLDRFKLIRTDKPKISRQTLHSKIRYYIHGPMKKEEQETISSIILPAYVEYKKYKEEIEKIINSNAY